jgi:hypothetical protein
MTRAYAQVLCRGCGDPYRNHEAGGGPCLTVDEDGRCPCLGFRWIDVEAPAPSYSQRPLWPADRG